jgi:hypothetical protein
MTTLIFFLFFWYAVVLAKRSMKKLTPYITIFLENDKFYFKKFDLIFILILFQ